MYIIFRIFIIGLLVVAPLSFAQETVEDVAVSDNQDELLFLQESDPIQIGSVYAKNKSDGTTEIFWETNRLAIGAVTVLYREGASYPDRMIQQRLTSGELSTSHSYVLRGIRPGDHSVVIESISSDMQYDRFLAKVSVPTMSKNNPPASYLLVWLLSLTMLVMVVVLYEIIKHRIDFKKMIKLVRVLEKDKAKARRSKTSKKKAPARKLVKNK